MSLLGTLIGGAVSLIGANKQAKAQKEANYNNSPAGIRANSEAAGFNPLVFAGPGTITQYAPQMGNALMDIGGLIQDGLTEAEKLKIQKAELEQENERLSKQSAKARLRPTVPGVYAKGGISPTAKGSLAEQGEVIDLREGAGPSDNRITEGGQVRPRGRLTYETIGQDPRVWNAKPGDPIRVWDDSKNRHVWYRAEDNNVIVRNQMTGHAFGHLNPDLYENGPLEIASSGAALASSEAGVDPLLTADRYTEEERDRAYGSMRNALAPPKRREREEKRRKEKKLPLYLQRLQ